MKNSLKSQEKRIIIAIALNFVITAVEVAGGVLAGSLALLSDALHNLTDAFALITTLLAIKFSQKRHTLRRTFGYKRAEVLAALLNASILVGISFILFKEAVIRLVSPVEIKGGLMIVVASVGLVANTFSVCLLKRDASESMNIKSSYMHLLADVFSSVSVLAGGVFIYLFRVNWVDSLLTVVIGVYVLKEGYQIITKAVNILMQSAPSGIDLKAIQYDIERLDEVKNIHHVHLWCVTEKDIHFEAHLEVASDMRVSETEKVKEKIEKLLKEKYGITHTTFQFEYNACPDTDLIHT